MKDINNHIIQTVSIEADFMQAKQDMQLQNRMASILKEDLLPQLELLFNDKAPHNRQIKIDKLDIELGIITAENWERVFVDESVKKIKEKLGAISSFTDKDATYEISFLSKDNVLEKQDAVHYQADALIYFIQTGILPWYINEPAKDWFSTIEEIFKQHVLKDYVRQRLNATIFSSVNNFTRFITQLPEQLVAAIIQSLTGIDNNAYKTVLQMNVALQEEALSAKIYLLKHLAAFAIKGCSVNVQLIKNILTQTFSKDLLKKTDIFFKKEKHPAQIKPFVKLVKETIANAPKIKGSNEDENKIDKKNADNVLTEDAIFIENAGLVILHPFLKPLFTHLHFTEKEKFINEEMQVRSVLFTQYLITGETKLPEYELLLNKLLCGYPLQQTLTNTIELTKEEITEAEDLLQSVVTHWSALKNTGIEALRNTFLKRPGKLTETEDHWLLQVELKSFDVLMGYLPWSISIIQLPWMKKKLMVEW